MTFFTFLPSFIFIFAGGPLVEATHGKLAFAAPLTAITAAVVGVIAQLALFFIHHLVWPQGANGAVNGMAAVMAIAAGVALIRFKRGAVEMIAVCALAGLTLRLAGF